MIDMMSSSVLMRKRPRNTTPIARKMMILIACMMCKSRFIGLPTGAAPCSPFLRNECCGVDGQASALKYDVFPHQMQRDRVLGHFSSELS